MVSDQDIELLEASLDAQISPQQQTALDVRLAANPELASVLTGLVHGRQSRAAAWESLAFTDTSVDHAIGRIEQSLDRHSWFQGLLGQWQRLAVAAACLAMFATGMYFRDTYGLSSQRSPMQMSQPVNMVMDQNRGTPAQQQQQFEFRVNDPSGSHQFHTLEEAEAYIARLQMQLRLNAPQPLPR